MTSSLPVVLVPGLACSPRIYEPQIPALWRHGPVTVANHIRDASMAAIARRIGYIAFEIVRQAPERVARLALLSTSARPETAEATARRRGWIAEVEAGGYRAVMERLAVTFVHPARADDAAIQQTVLAMADDVGPQAFVAQLEAIMGRADSRPTLAQIGCPTLVLTSDTDNMVPNAFSSEIAEGIAGAKLVVIPDCGHLPQLETPEAMTAALLDWLAM